MKRARAYKGYARTYSVEILNSFGLELQLKDTEYVIRNKLIDLATELKGIKFVTTLFLELKKIESDDKRKHDTFYSNSKAEAIINESEIDNAFESIFSTFISNI